MQKDFFKKYLLCKRGVVILSAWMCISGCSLLYKKGLNKFVSFHTTIAFRMSVPTGLPDSLPNHPWAADPTGSSLSCPRALDGLGECGGSLLN